MPVSTTRGRRPSSARSAAIRPAWSAAAAAARRMAAGWPAISAMNMSGKFPNECTAHRLQCRAVVGNPKIAVIGGGSTYTPELIEGLALRAERLGIAELVLHDIDEGRLDIVGGLAGRILRQAEVPRPVLVHHRSRAGDRGGRVRARAAAGRRPGGAAPGRDRAGPVRLHRPGDDGRRRVRQGAADGAGGARHRPRHRPPGRRRRVAARLHQPGRARRPGADRRRPPRDRPLQHPDRLPAPAGRPAGGRARSGRARARRPEPPVVGARRVRGRRRQAARAHRDVLPTSSARTSTCPAT